MRHLLIVLAGLALVLAACGGEGDADAKTVEKCLKDEQNLELASSDQSEAGFGTVIQIDFAPGQTGTVYVFKSEDDAKDKESDIKTFAAAGGAEERNGNVVVVYSPEVPKQQQQKVDDCL